MDRISEMAAEMGVTRSDLLGWLDCIRLWMAKGYSFEVAINKHMEQMRRLANSAVEIASKCRDEFADAVWNEVHGAAT